MNCCDTYGNCNQGRDCPARKASKAAEKSPTPAEAGNVWFAGEEPTPTPIETIAAWSYAIVESVISLVLAGFIAGFIYQRFFN